MSLLDQEVKKQEPKGKKLVLFLLILSIMLLVFAIVAMVALSGKQTKKLTLSINGNNINVTNDLIITDENGLNYISIQKVAKQLGYTYSRGGYKEYSEDGTNTKCYLEKEKQIIQIEVDNKKVYKTTPDSIIDFEEIELKLNNSICISLEDLPAALNVLYTFSQNENNIRLNTIENLVETYKASIVQSQDSEITSISEDYDNQKAILYDMLVVSNSKGKWGVVRPDYTTIIGNKYDSITFIEQEKVFIVSDNNKYGVISIESGKKPIIDLSYEEINVVGYNPLCYEVKLSGKSIILNKEGKVVINEAYDSIGYISSINTEESAALIKDIGKDHITVLVVCKEGKYGLLNINEAKLIGTCNLDKIYSKNENGKKKYYVVMQEQEMELDTYIENINTTVINVG